ncbi:hypothetical protein B0H12DRAFT_1149783 [Mycena haematopus]|nr:hypothetical protein B0H12DRAFT_1149783 [Mycena haematopus]
MDLYCRATNYLFREFEYSSLCQEIMGQWVGRVLLLVTVRCRCFFAHHLPFFSFGSFQTAARQVVSETSSHGGSRGAS